MKGGPAAGLNGQTGRDDSYAVVIRMYRWMCEMIAIHDCSLNSPISLHLLITLSFTALYAGDRSPLYSASLASMVACASYVARRLARALA